MLNRFLLAVLVVSPAALLLAQASTAPKAVIEGLKRVIPQVQVDSSKEVAPGIHEVILDSRVIYVTSDGNFVFTGSLWDTSRRVDLTEETNKRLRRAVIRQIAKGQMVSYVPDKPRHRVVVFTDVDCGYCRKFHAHMPEFQRLGIRVDYLLVPFRGEQAYKKAVGVWCAEDRNAAMDRAKSGMSIPLRECDNPVEAHLRAAQEVGVTGTPAIMLDSGSMIRGYVPPAKLFQVLAAEAS